MGLFGKLWFLVVWSLRRPLFWWTQITTAPSDPNESLGIDHDKPVLYVLPTASLSDRLIANRVCKLNGLPIPKRAIKALPDKDNPGCLYLPALVEGAEKKRRPQIEALIAKALEDQEYDLQIVPLSILWGRDPGKESSIFKILFSDSERPSRLRKLFIILTHGRAVLANFGQPIQFREFAAENLSGATARRKLFRVLRVHFRRQRTATLGPRLARRPELVRSLLAHPSVREAIQREIGAGTEADKAQKAAARYAREIAADYSHIAIEFLRTVLTWVFSRIYNGLDVRHANRLRDIAPGHEIIYLPSHRSHFDYLLISYACYFQGLVPPHIAAGINLNFWPVGGLLRRSGAFYLRRTFSGNALYTAVFRAYIDLLIQKGYSMEFFPEGGRSRTGRLMKPKTGLLAMAVDSYLRDHDRPVMIVPVYVGYDRLAEGNSYIKELRGGKKEKESAGGLLKATQILKTNYGKAYLAFGRPISLGDFLDNDQPGWQEQSYDFDNKPEWLNGAVKRLADSSMVRVNCAAVVNPVGIVAVALLSTPQNAIAEAELTQQIDSYLELLRRAPYSDDVTLPEMNGAALLEQAEAQADLKRTPHAWGDILSVEGRQAVLLTYYRNTIQHLFALPALIARFLRHQERIAEHDLIDSCMDVYPFLRSEYFLRGQEQDTREQIHHNINVLIDMQLLQRDGDILIRPAIDSNEFSILIGLGRIMREAFERYCLTTLALASHLDVDAHIERNAFEEQCRSMAERMALLNGREAPEFFDRALFRGFLDTAIEQQLVKPDGDEGALIVQPAARALASHAIPLLGQDVQQSMLQLIMRPTPLAGAEEEPTTEP